jgi:hypothetical protein
MSIIVSIFILVCIILMFLYVIFTFINKA